jgi:flagellar basal body-associated protein FliL
MAYANLQDGAKQMYVKCFISLPLNNNEINLFLYKTSEIMAASQFWSCGGTMPTV